MSTSAKISTTPPPPYFAVIFTSRLGVSDPAYGQMADAMDQLAREQPGFLGLESARDAEGLGITVSYWRDEAAIAAWKRDARHLVAQRLGRAQWYAAYSVRVARVDREYGTGTV